LRREALAAKVGRQTKKIIAGWDDDLRGYPAGARAGLFVVVFEQDCANEVGEAPRWGDDTAIFRVAFVLVVEAVLRVHAMWPEPANGREAYAGHYARVSCIRQGDEL
jgi:hypothetical protein